MIVIGSFPAALAAFVAALWLAIMIWVTIAGIRRWRAAGEIGDEAERLAELLHGSPAIPMLVAGDGRIEADSRLAAWLGLPRLPRYLPDLVGAEGGLSPDDAQALARDVAASQKAARSFSRTIAVRGSERALTVRGRPSAIAGRVILWFFDSTDMQEEIAALRGEGARMAHAIDALSAIIEAAPFPIWHRGPDLRLALVNSAYVGAVEGVDAVDVVVRGLELDDAVESGGPLAAAAAARDETRAIGRTIPATVGGARRTIRVVDVPLGDAGVAGYAIDVEDLEEARADLARFARAQRDMLDLLSAGVAQFGADRSLVFSNQPFQRLFAMKPEWVADRPEFDHVLERMRETNRVPESRDFPSWKAERRAWFTAGEDAQEETWLLPGGTHLRVLAQPLPDGGLLLIFEDRTEQVQLASARDTLLQVRTATFNNLFEAIAVFAADGRLHLWNDRFKEVWALDDAYLAGRPRVDALVEHVAKRLANPARAGLIRELVRIATAERRQRNGRVTLADERHFEFAAVPLPDGNALFTMLDVTDSRKVERALRDQNEALAASDKLKDAFVANMSYELRTPLTSISGFAELLQRGYAGALEPTAQDYVAAILESVTRLSVLIDNVLDLTQVEAGSLPMAEETVDLAAIGRAATDDIAASVDDNQLELSVEIDPSVGKVRGDPRRLRQVMDHLLRNAVGYTPAGGRVLFHATGDAAAAEIVVSDNGIGIPADEHERVFTRLNRTALASSDGRPATGLGLPLTRQFVEAHGGTVKLLSKPGQGTAVIVRLPRRR